MNQKKRGMIKDNIENEFQQVPGWEQFLARAEKMLDGNNNEKVILAEQLWRQEQNEERIGALEKIFLCQKEIFNFDEAADYLSMSKSTLYKLTAKKEIPHFKPNRFVFFEKAELDQWIRDHRVMTIDEIDAAVQGYCVRKPMATV